MGSDRDAKLWVWLLWTVVLDLGQFLVFPCSSLPLVSFALASRRSERLWRFRFYVIRLSQVRACQRGKSLCDWRYYGLPCCRSPCLQDSSC